ANRAQTLLFARSTAYSVLLEFFAAVTGREEEYEIGAWTYPRVFVFYFLERRGRPRVAPTNLASELKRHPSWLLTVPIDVAWFLPRDIWRAYRAGCLQQVIETMRGLWDGVLDRPLPLRRLGLA